MNATEEVAANITFSSTRFGVVEISEDKIISFVRGIPGFEKLRKFVLIDHDADGLFRWLQAVDDPDVAFLLTNPTVYKPGYTVPLSKSEIEGLDVQKTEEIVTLVMVTISRSDKQLSLNLKGPVVFNSSNMKAVQCIIDSDDYPTQYMITV